MGGISIADSALCVLPDGQHVLGLLTGRHLQLRDPMSGQLLIELPGGDLRLYRLALWPLGDHRLIAAAGSDFGRIKLWSVHLTAQEVTERVLDGHKGDVATLAFCPRDQHDAYLVTGCRGGILELRNATDGRPLHRLLNRPGNSVIDARFLSGHGAPAVVATYRDVKGAGEVAIWHADSGVEIPIKPPPLPGPVPMLAAGTSSGPIICALRGDAVASSTSPTGKHALTVGPCR